MVDLSKRDEIGLWIADLLNVGTLVPDAYQNWRPLVHDAMAFVASHLSAERLAPKVAEQMALPLDTPVEKRLGMVIAKTPGLQKLGQVLARTRRLSPALKQELQKLENSIADTTVAEIQSILAKELGACVGAYQVRFGSRLYSEATVSAILEFTWLNPTTGKREEGVFKVMKPHIPECYAEDLRLLQDLAEHLASRSGNYGIASREVVETLDDVRLLLEREVDFRQEQATLAEVNRVYRRSGAHAPLPIPELCTSIVTAMSFERGVKVTDAFPDQPLWRRRVAVQIVEAVLANPIFSDESEAVFHADPHAGNLLYDEGKKELIVLDWALTGRLSRQHRRQLARLLISMTFRNAEGVRDAIRALAKEKSHRIIDRSVQSFFNHLPHACSLGAMDAMRLLEQIGTAGVRFPGALILIRKVLFTLDGVLHDITGGEVRIDSIVTREFVTRWIEERGRLPAPFNLSDYLAMQKAAFRYASGLWAWPSHPRSS